MNAPTELNTPGARTLFLAASLVIVVAGLRAGAPILLPIALALFLAVLNLPFLFWLHARRIPRMLAIFIALLINVAILGVLALVISQAVVELRVALPHYVDRFRVLSDTSVDWLQARRVPVSDWTSLELFSTEKIINLVSGTLRGIASLLANAFLVLLIMIFMLSEATIFPAKLRAAIGGDEADLSRYRGVIRDVQQYLGIKTAVSLLTGVLIGLWTWSLGLDFPLFWGLIAFLFNYVPNIGSILAAIPAVLLATLELGPGRALVIGAGYLVVNVVLGNFVEPNLHGRRFGISTLVVILSLVFWGWVWGPVGMILSLPLTMILKIAMENTEDFRWIAVLLGGAPRARPEKGTGGER
ncbi:AI-2E family transporter [soil metagenome]